MNFYLKYKILLLSLLLCIVGCNLKNITANRVVEEDLPKIAEQEKNPQRVASMQLTEEGRQALLEGDIEDAMDIFERSVAIDAHNPYTYYYFAKSKYEIREFDESLVLLSQAESLFEDNDLWLSKVYTLMGRNYEGLKKFDDALLYYKKAEELNKANEDAKQRIRYLGNKGSH